MFLVLATGDCLVVCDTRQQFLDLKSKMEALFEVTLQEGAILRFLNLRIIQSPVGISIDQTDNIAENVLDPYFQDHDTADLRSITSPFPTDTSFEQRIYEAPVLTGTALKAMELKHGGSLYHWNGVLLHVAITTRIDINYAVMHIVGYLAAPNAVIFEGLEHTLRYVYFFRHIPIFYLSRPLNKRSLALHWAKGTAEFLAPEFGTVLVNSSDADYARDIRDRRSGTSHIHLINGVAVS
jgi:hypothetical protein